MKLLHVASFNGNVGDYINHMGFRRMLEEEYTSPIQYTELEMREFYRSWNLRKFDQDFAAYANQFDLVVFGGGNFFELCWDYSATGTTIDLSDEVLDAITTPILFNGLGVDDKRGTVSQDNIRKFGVFLEHLIERNEYLTVRNDGSKEILARYYDADITKNIRKIPDGGFFVKPRYYEHAELPHMGQSYPDLPEQRLEKKRTVLAVNVAGDSIGVRFALKESKERLSVEAFCRECQTALRNLLEHNSELYLVMVPHISKDLELIYQIISGLPDPLLRTRVSVAPCLNGARTDGAYIADLYRQSDVAVGMRYHANIAAIAGNTPTIGIVNLEKHKKMYEDIGLSHRLLPSDEPDFAHRLIERVNLILANPGLQQEENQRVLNRLEQENKRYLTDMLGWLAKRRIGGYQYEANQVSKTKTGRRGRL